MTKKLIPISIKLNCRIITNNTNNNKKPIGFYCAMDRNKALNSALSPEIGYSSIFIQFLYRCIFHENLSQKYQTLLYTLFVNYK